MKSKLSSSFYMSHSSNAFLLFLYGIKLITSPTLRYQFNWFKSMDNPKHCDAICGKVMKMPKQSEPTSCYEFELSSDNKRCK